MNSGDVGSTYNICIDISILDVFQQNYSTSDTPIYPNIESDMTLCDISDSMFGGFTLRLLDFILGVKLENKI